MTSFDNSALANLGENADLSAITSAAQALAELALQASERIGQKPGKASAVESLLLTALAAGLLDNVEQIRLRQDGAAASLVL